MAKSKPARLDPKKATAEVSWGPEDNVEASSAPIPLEPTVGVRKNFDPVASAVAGQLYDPRGIVRGMRVDGMDPTTAARMRGTDDDLSVDNDTDMEAVAIIAERLMAQGMDRATAYARAKEQVLIAKQGVRDEMNTPAPPNEKSRPIEERQAMFEQGYNEATGAPQPSDLSDFDGARDWSGWKPGMPLPQLGAGGGMRPGRQGRPRPAGQTVPGPRMPNGLPVKPSEPIYDADEATAYKERPWNADSGAWTQSPQDNAMRARGYVPIYNEDGSIGYAIGYLPRELNPDGRGAEIPGGPGRAGQRRDLEDSGWKTEQRMGPLGPQTVYVPGDERQKSFDEQDERLARKRIAKSAGLSSAEAMGLSMDDLRSRADAARIDDYNARNRAWKAQSMLAGGRPTGGVGGSKATVNAWNALGDQGLNDWQRLTMAKALRPDIEGTTPLTVEANSARNALRMINADMIGQGGFGDARLQALQQQARVAADQMAQAEAGKILGWGKKTLTRQEADRIRRRIEGVYPGMGGVVEGLPIEEAAPAPRENPVRMPDGTYPMM